MRAGFRSASHSFYWSRWNALYKRCNIEMTPRISMGNNFITTEKKAYKANKKKEYIEFKIQTLKNENRNVP